MAKQQTVAMVSIAKTRPQWAFYKNCQAQVPFNSGIHPGRRSARTKIRKRQNNIANHQARREVNQRRSHGVQSNPTWHGIGRHAGVATGH